MPLIVSSLIATLSLIHSTQTPEKQVSLLEQLKPFEGEWTGTFKSGSTTMDLTMNWHPFGGHWAEVSYSYSTPKFKLEYRVMIVANKENTGFSVWSFGNDAKVPEEMTGKMDASTLVVDRSGKDPFLLKFSLDSNKNMIMSLVTKSDAKEMGRGDLKRVIAK